MSVNKVLVLGRLGQNPELKYTPSGSAVCNFTVATSESYKKKDGTKEEKTEWHRIVSWGKTAENVNKFLSKGSVAFVEGKLETRSWEDKEGNKRYTTEIVASRVDFVGGRENKGENQKDPGQGKLLDQDYKLDTNPSFTADDIPF